MASVLIVVAHPDDEVLGCGATAAKLSEAGHDVWCTILCSDADARHKRPSSDELQADTDAALARVGIRQVTPGAFPNIQLNTVPTLQVVQHIESAIEQVGATTLFTHHPHDLNDDHLHTSRATQAAARLFQRREGIPRLQQLYFMEVPSSSDWAFPGTQQSFRADTFVEIGKAGVERKLAALAAYRDVMRSFPHPRSREVIEGLAAYRGGQAGMDYAEAFQTAFNLLSV
jgi:LmbE family N-acetylglucosaminyl deacetylase